MAERVVVWTDSGAKLNLGAADHVATGGEGTVYARRDSVFKVYLDPAKARSARMEGKVAALRALKHPGIAAPTGILRDAAGKFVGIEMPRYPGEALCKLFTNTWRDAHQFKDVDARVVAQGMREVMSFAHANQALLVDCNELNWLVDDRKPVAIDTDSWAIGGFPATAIMGSIQDPTLQRGANGMLQFNEGSDWFAWAVVTFQLWTGMHPFKGSHPRYPRTAFAARMKDGVSVFDKDVTLPSAARPVANIPSNLRHWYAEVFAHHARFSPPTNWDSVVHPQGSPRLKLRQLVGGDLRQERIGRAGSRVLTEAGGYVVAEDGRRLSLWDPWKRNAVTWVDESNIKALIDRQAVLVKVDGSEALVRIVRGHGIEVATRAHPDGSSTIPSDARSLWQVGDRAFALIEGISNGLVELRVSVAGGRSILSVDRQWPVSVLSTSFHRGCFVQDCLGVPYIGVLEAGGLLQLRARGLLALKVVDAFSSDRHNVWVTAIRKSDGETVRMRLEALGDDFVVQEEEAGAECSIVAGLLDSGVAVVRLGEALRISRGVNRRDVDSCGLPPSAILLSLGSHLGMAVDGDVSRLSLR